MKKILVALMLPALLHASLAATLADWKFDKPGDLQGWQPNKHLTNATVTSGGLTVGAAGANPILEYHGALKFATTGFQKIEIRLKADHDGMAVFYWSNTTSGKFGGFAPEKTTRFNVRGDGQWHTYCLLPSWQTEGEIIRLRLDLYDETSFALDFIRITALPTVPALNFNFMGSAQDWQAIGPVALQSMTNGLKVTLADTDGFVLAPPLSVPITTQVVVAVHMATTQGVRGTLCYTTKQARSPKHVRRGATAGASRHYFTFPLQADGREHTYILDLRHEKHWCGQLIALGLQPSDVVGASARVCGLRLVDAPQNPPQAQEGVAAPSTKAAVVRADYVPEPQPVRGPFEVGAYYFPGWNTAERWQQLANFPERRPVLGCYREGDPEVADWHIKWAVEHGITFFAYDWYWKKGERHLEHALHDGYFKARYHHLLKFCLLWANHNPPHTSSLADCIAVTRYWIENYFRRPEHLHVDGKPVVIIFSPYRFTEDMGADGVKAALAAMRAECRAAGLPGLHIIAVVSSPNDTRLRAAEGYDSVTAYNWPRLNMTDFGQYAPYATLLPGFLRQWTRINEKSPIPLMPLPLCGGWDSRPWHGEDNVVRYGRTPELFKQHLRDAKNFLQQPAARGTKMALIEAWNEWGEGSYIEPHREFGFGYLDAIREVFTAAPPTHHDVTPAEVGLGPYEVSPTNSPGPAH